MYLDSDSGPASVELKTGDIIELNTEDFGNLIKHDSMKNLLQQFGQDNPARPHLWAILNKACDMIYEQKKGKSGRAFNKNLFICPLQGFLDSVKKDPLKKRILQVNEFKKPYTSAQKIIENKAMAIIKKEIPSHQGESIPDYNNKRIKERLETSLSTLLGYLKEVEEEDDPHAFEEAALRVARNVDQESIVEFLKDVFSAVEWGKFKKSYDSFVDKNKKLRTGSSKADDLKKLFNNQLESEGFFFFEPNEKIFRKDFDLSYIINFEDMLTLKIREGAKRSGEIVRLLKEKRVLCLRDQFSNRLQNMMGAYFSKIGTDDISAEDIGMIYKKHFSDRIDLGHPEGEEGG